MAARFFEHFSLLINKDLRNRSSRFKKALRLYRKLANKSNRRASWQVEDPKPIIRQLTSRGMLEPVPMTVPDALLTRVSCGIVAARALRKVFWCK